MKPQLTALGEGAHNDDLEATRTRLLRGASWKNQRVVVVIPAGATIPAKVYLSHLGLIFPPNNGRHYVLAQGMEVGEAYSNALAAIATEPNLSKWEYVLTVEHDNTPPQDGVLKLVERMEEHPELAAISGLYFTKGPGGVAQIWGDVKDPVTNFRPQVPDGAGGLVECYGIGMGFALFRMAMFRDDRLEKPLFKTKKGTGGVATQDLYFWTNARKLGYRCAVDCSVRVGHYDLEGTFGIPDFTW